MKLFLLLATLGAVELACGSSSSGFDAPPLEAGPPGVLAPSDGGAPEAAPAACAESTHQAVPVPLDVVFLLDRSGSMLGPKWDAASHAILAFTNQGFPAPTRIGLSFVPFIIQEDVFGDQIGTNYKECDYRLYQDLVVPLAPVTTQRGPLETAIGNAITPAGFGFGGETPLYAALEGTYWAATKAQDANPDHQVAVVIMTDGDPTPCADYGPETTSTDALSALAASALHYNGVRTFALALENGAAGLLDKVSSAGGGSVLTPASQSEGDFLAQMNVVTKSATECSFRLPVPPDGQALDPTTVNLDVTASTGEKTRVPPAAGPTSCHGEDGWYFDDAAVPTKAILCPATCAALKSASGSRIDIVLGCKAPLK